MTPTEARAAAEKIRRHYEGEAYGLRASGNDAAADRCKAKAETEILRALGPQVTDPLLAEILGWSVGEVRGGPQTPPDTAPDTLSQRGRPRGRRDA